jgi:methylated-DNA-[protein]-cysteine S-methyltransferase
MGKSCWTPVRVQLTLRETMNIGYFEKHSACLVSSPFGPVAIVWHVYCGRPRILRVLLSKPKEPARKAVLMRFPEVGMASCSELSEVARQMEAFLSGDDVGFSLDKIRLDLCSAFQQQVLRAEHGIPRGQVSTYKRIAVHLGRPTGARAVGNALAGNPFPIIIPCHRAVRSDRSLGGYQGGLRMKRRLLEMEGMTFDDAGRIATKKLFY